MPTKEEKGKCLREKQDTFENQLIDSVRNGATGVFEVHQERFGM